MSSPLDSEFRTLTSRALAGDPDAVADLIYHHADLLRGMLLVQFSLRPNGGCDSPDPYQAEMGAFMTSIRDRAFHADDVDQLVVVFRRMMIRKAIEKVRRLTTSCRCPDQAEVAFRASDQCEEYQLIKNHLCDMVRQIVELRLDCVEWDEIAAVLGITPKAARESLADGLARVAASLQFREVDTPFV